MSYGRDGMWIYLNRGESMVVKIACPVYKEPVRRTGGTQWSAGYIGYKMFGGNWMSVQEKFAAYKAAKADENAGRPLRIYVVDLFVPEDGKIFRMEMGGGLMSALRTEMLNAMIEEGVSPSAIQNLGFKISKKNEKGSLTNSPWIVKREPSIDGPIPAEAYVDFKNREAVKGNPVHIQEFNGADVDIAPVSGTEYTQASLKPKKDEVPAKLPMNEGAELVDEAPAVLSVGESNLLAKIITLTKDQKEIDPEINVINTIKKTLVGAKWSDAKIKYALTLPEVVALQKL